MAKKRRKRAASHKKRRRINPLRLLLLLVLELSILLALLVYLARYHPDNPISKAIVNIAQIEQKQELVVLDAGHGGYDVGSEYQGIYEKDITLALTKEIGEELERRGIPVLYTRESDEVSWPSNEAADLKARVAVSNESSASLFVSVHTNASELKNGQGFEVWGDLQDEEISRIVQQITSHVSELPYILDRGSKDSAYSPLQVLYDNTLPAVLIEAGFLESSADRAYLLDEEKRRELAVHIADGIEASLQEMGALPQ